MFEKDIRVADLIYVYGALLSDRRREIIEAYYYDDLSLSEIADNTGISRQGVRDSIKKSEAELRLLEEKLCLSERIRVFEAEKDRLLSRIEEICAELPSSAASELRLIVGELREKNV